MKVDEDILRDENISKGEEVMMNKMTINDNFF